MPEIQDTSEERIQKATDILSRIWWFLWFILLVPFIVGLVILVILNMIIGIDIMITIAFSVLGFMFALLFCYKAYDKYRTEPYFESKENNLIARIHILFIISILSLITAPIFIYVTPEDYNFELLPLISFICLYNGIWFYYYFQPADYYNRKEKEFQHLFDIKLIVKQLHNLVIAFNYIIQMVLISITFYTTFSWLFALIPNLVMYFITLVYTRKDISKIKGCMEENKLFFNELTIFHKKFVISVISLIFIFLIMTPLAFVFITDPEIPLLDPGFLSVLCLTIIFVIIYLKFRLYIQFYYKALLIGLADLGEMEEYEGGILNE